VAKIIHFTSRGAMDIEGMGEERIAQFVDAGSSSMPPTLPAHRRAHRGLPRLGHVPRSSIDAIDGSRSRPLCACSSRSDPARRAHCRASVRSHFAASTDRRRDRRRPSRSTDRHDHRRERARWFAEPLNAAFVEKLRERDVALESPAGVDDAPTLEPTLAGVTFVLTAARGRTVRSRRGDRSARGKVASSVSKDRLRAGGRQGGSKLAKPKSSA